MGWGFFCAAFPIDGHGCFGIVSLVKCWGRSRGGSSSAFVPLSPGSLSAGLGPDETNKQVCAFRFLNYRLRRNTDTQSIKK